VGRQDPSPHAAARGPQALLLLAAAHRAPDVGAVGGDAALSTYYEGQSDPNNPEHVELNTIRLLAKLPVIAAYAHKKSIGQAFLYPDNSLSFVDNFLKLNFGNLAECTR
jgi:citrate synthase